MISGGGERAGIFYQKIKKINKKWREEEVRLTQDIFLAQGV